MNFEVFHEWWYETDHGSFSSEREIAKAAWDKALITTRLKFTTDAPTEPGYYWVRAKPGEPMLMAEVREFEHVGLRFSTNGFRFGGMTHPGIGLDVVGVDFEWAGPIPMPVESNPPPSPTLNTAGD